MESNRGIEDSTSLGLPCQRDHQIVESKAIAFKTLPWSCEVGKIRSWYLLTLGPKSRYFLCKEGRVLPFSI